MSEIPPIFLENMQRLLGTEYADFLAAYAHAPVSGLRVNTLKISPQALQERLPLRLAPVPGIPAGLRMADDWAGETPGSSFAAGKHPYHAAGLYYLQEPSAMSAAELLAAQPGETVLDLCAAPGGKSTHLAALMQNQGALVANEIHPRRVWELAENLERWGVHHTAITQASPENIARQVGPFFDRVLVDAPCSGEGMFRKSETARQEWLPDLVQRCALRQKDILDQAVELVRPGGWLAYSTCTFNPDENEAVISRLLEVHPQFEIVESQAIPGSAAGRPEWLAGGKAQPELEKAVRLWPHRLAGEGHFVALLQRSGPSSHPGQEKIFAGERKQGKRRPDKKPDRLPTPVLHALQEFIQSTLQGEILTRFQEAKTLRLVGSYLYLLPEGLPDLEGLPVIHPGWWLGSIKTGQSARFEPSQALAMGLKANDCQQTLRLKPDDPRLPAYLRGEILRSGGETESFCSGWVLVTVDGFPLGWGKYAQGTIKNSYPRGLRWV